MPGKEQEPRTKRLLLTQQPSPLFWALAATPEPGAIGPVAHNPKQVESAGEGRESTFSSHLSLGILLNLSEPQFTHL
jgi:hypothetical protein